eukprot:CAMPEP_0114441358 /NCGR_PEP_ID=MMETSP0103-20121206/16326_1 /TAXON_ID=37642 ORGANISM="Paraphysomonas imperforata, Strain PA2" /NCGR_SAMPLE_ID=MMETSP0103 /ASSEMBLY_ACC=CAM_ASM_000201 /LENGTH=868 /DNA_ID=CAMNT_0001612455 /DNA_START=211 /DNA_END=2816 /DNA_ORIENTATION=-
MKGISVKPADYVTFAGRGAINYAITNTDIRTVHLHTTHYFKERNESALARLSSVKGVEKGFGRTTKLVNHPFYPDAGSLLFVSAGDPESLKGSAYVFTGKWDAWTQLQRFSPPPEHTYSDFGKVLDVDSLSLSSAVVGCPLCNDTRFAGQIYVYSPNPVTSGGNALTHTWSQSQVLIADVHSFHESPDKVAFFLGSKVKIHGDVILGMAQMYPHLSVMAYVRSSATGIWSYQQALRLEDSVSSFSVYDDTIVLSTTNLAVNGHSGAGAAYIYYPNTNEYFVLSNNDNRHANSHRSTGFLLENDNDISDSISLDSTPHQSSDEKHSDSQGVHMKVNPAPRSTHWSQHQTLYAPLTANSNNFGSDVSLQKNQLVIGEQGTSSVYLFRRTGALASMWSQSQILQPLANDVDFFSRSFLHGSTLVVAGIIGTQTHLETFTSSKEWGCLIVEVMDTFGDGWGESQLEVQTPIDGTYDYFAPYCNYPNPFTFRYCPDNPEDAGAYKFSVPGGVLSPYHWEIQYQIYEEKSNTWYYGGSETIMVFNFNSSDLKFHYDKDQGVNVKQSRDTCSACPATNPFESWAYLEVKMMATNGYGWFQDSYQGTSYSISDADGHRQLVSGTTCEPSSQGGQSDYNCWHVLVDGAYTFRVTGDLNDHSSGDMSWSFCNTTGSESIHMFFKIKDGECHVVAIYPLQSICNTRVNTLNKVSLTMETINTSAVEGIAGFASVDRGAFSVSLANLLSFVDARDIQFVNVISYSDVVSNSSTCCHKTTISVNLYINTLKAGYDPLDLGSMNEMTALAVSTLRQEIETDDTFFNILKGTSAFNSTFFRYIQSLSLLQLTVDDAIDVIHPAQMQTYATEVNADGSSFIREI